MKGPTLTLNNGVEMPAFGLGVYQSGPDETVAAVKAALVDGCRMIDTAAAYMNEAEVGQGIRESGVPRNEVFIQTKLWMSDYGYDQTLHAFDRSMKKLGLETLDLYLLHWPVPKQFDLCGRDAGYPTPPAQSPACSFSAPGSSVVLADAQGAPITRTPSADEPR
jgi:diketogulonate reductase-like aldo/keto reductase